MRHIESVTVTVKALGKQPQRYEVSPVIAKRIEQMLEQAAKESSKDNYVPAKQVFPDVFDPEKSPAIMLRGMRYREELTQKELADRLGIRQHHLSEMENGKRAIGKELAKKLGATLRADYRVFL